MLSLGDRFTLHAAGVWSSASGPSGAAVVTFVTQTASKARVNKEVASPKPTIVSFGDGDAGSVVSVAEAALRTAGFEFLPFDAAALAGGLLSRAHAASVVAQE
jgi:hypothetical protein